MKQSISESIQIPEGVSCLMADSTLVAKKGGNEVKKVFQAPLIEVKVENNSIVFSSKKGNKNQLKVIMSFVAHINNIFKGLNEPFVYKLQTCNVHFPMTLKVEKDRLIINNFLGEKKPRSAKILPETKVDVKGQNITITSSDKEAAGETATNIEKATKIRNRDRRIFQDGIYITEKPGVKI